MRTLISVPAGVANMPIGTFLALSFVGTLIWTSALAVAGYLLGQAYSGVTDYVDPVWTGVLLLLAAIYVYRVITYRHEPE